MDGWADDLFPGSFDDQRYWPVGEHPELQPYGPLGPHRPEHPQITQLRAERDELRQDCAGLRAMVNRLNHEIALLRAAVAAARGTR